MEFFCIITWENACDGVGGTTKREVTKASLQRTVSDHILTPEDMYVFCSQKITGISYIYVKGEEIIARQQELVDRFDNCQKLPGTRTFHRYVPLSESVMRCYLTSKSEEYVDLQVTKVVPLTLRNSDIIACVYDEQWWLGVIEDSNLERRDVYVKFYHPSGPRTSFKMSHNDRVWVPLNKVLRRLGPSELSTATGRSHNISTSLCEEISMLLNKHGK